ncbi:formate--tetrahydrofolate ligase [Treponema parvum]|uniref:Formate--tetrahydrofolate ligase n=1 Tax=Treponema parvum TaxID=138851 RepID=A0A975IFK7_9SPIR|nr:formate--tetrahydrofolate ligase [Treponema parvum]QTQ14459.1 formate--tetrahydrofolate ligase [Treponema parvum]
MLSDIEIAHKAKIKPITEIAKKIGIDESSLDLYGPYKAKISMAELIALQSKIGATGFASSFEAGGKACKTSQKDLASHAPTSSSGCGKLILVTAITPTPAGEGKSTVSIGLGDGLSRIGKRSVIAIREPSLGPCFGVKGGACGGGYAQIVPMEDINLHFTGDIHAITSANNLIAALIDNHIHQGNELRIDPATISWKRCMDLNDRSLRNIVIGLGGKVNGIPREDHFLISVASEIMAIICLSRSISELKTRLGNIVIGRNYDGKPVTFGQLKCVGAAAALLKDAVRPNLVQTLEGTPVFAHGGPFANIAHGCNSINATLCALTSSDYTVTEAGFGADLGAEKFFDIKCRIAGLKPSAAVIVATIRALKMHGGVDKSELSKPNTAALSCGFENLLTHIKNVEKYGVPSVVAINKFAADTEEEISLLKELCERNGVSAVLCESWEKGGAGAEDLARAVVKLCDEKSDFHCLYESCLPLENKIECIATRIYRAGKVDIAPSAAKKLKQFTEDGFGNLPVCIAKTQNSISHDPSLICAPKGFTFPIRDVQLCAGAGFVVALAGDIMTMPGLPKMPAALNIDVDDNGVISGLF